MLLTTYVLLSYAWFEKQQKNGATQMRIVTRAGAHKIAFYVELSFWPKWMNYCLNIFKVLFLFCMHVNLIIINFLNKFLVTTFIVNMICGLNVTSSHPNKIAKWSHIIIISLVRPPKPRTKRKNSPTHPGTEKSGAKVVILGDLRPRFRVLICRFQTWASGYEEI